MFFLFALKKGKGLFEYNRNVNLLSFPVKVFQNRNYNRSKFCVNHIKVILQPLKSQ